MRFRRDRLPPPIHLIFPTCPDVLDTEQELHGDATSDTAALCRPADRRQIARLALLPSLTTFALQRTCVARGIAFRPDDQAPYGILNSDNARFPPGSGHLNASRRTARW